MPRSTRSDGWPAGPDDDPIEWVSAETTATILGVGEGAKRPDNPAVPRRLIKQCFRRFRKIRDELRRRWVGLVDENEQHLTDWLLACCLARENPLLLGPPGVAKSEMAVSLFELLELKPPEDLTQTLLEASGATDQEKWDALEKQLREKHRYFHYLLTRFTQQEELYGPVEISLLRKGLLARVNCGLLTGPGVRGAFLDEIFKAASSILNTLLTLMQERRFFNRGGMVPSDLVMLIGASNELPGAFAGGGLSAGGEDFTSHYAFLDRFALRLEVPLASPMKSPGTTTSDLAEATRLAIGREAKYFTSGRRFADPPPPSETRCCINDLLLLGRACLQHYPVDGRDNGEPAGGKGAPCLFQPRPLATFTQAFLKIAASLATENSRPALGRITWTVSPRKAKALYKIALAHAMICDDGFDGEAAETVSGPGEPQLLAFERIWDAPSAAPELRVKLRTLVAHHFQARAR